MSILEIDTVSFDEAARELVIIDQTLLPGRLELMRLSDAASIREAIRRLCVRGAPAIGVAAALAVKEGKDVKDVDAHEIQAQLRKQNVLIP